jgi:hypothetical protein
MHFGAPAADGVSAGLDSRVRPVAQWSEASAPNHLTSEATAQLTSAFFLGGPLSRARPQVPHSWRRTRTAVSRA